MVMDAPRIPTLLTDVLFQQQLAENEKAKKEQEKASKIAKAGQEMVASREEGLTRKPSAPKSPIGTTLLTNPALLNATPVVQPSGTLLGL